MLKTLDSWETLEKLIRGLAKKKQLGPDYLKRIDFEIKEINKQGANDYWLDAFNDRKKWEDNKNGLVIPWILGLTLVDPIRERIDHRVVYQPTFPDIDIDFLPQARDMIKAYAAEKVRQRKGL